MKNVFLVLFLFGTFTVSGLQAQSCIPCPVGSCAIKCCQASKSSADAFQLMPTSLLSMNSCSPEAMAACTPAAKAACGEGKNVSKKEMKSCQAACVAMVPTCQGAPGGQAASVNAAQPVEASMDQKFHLAPQPPKG